MFTPQYVRSYYADELVIGGRNSDHERHFVYGPPLLQSKYSMADGRHLGNRHDVIFQRRMFRFGRNSAADAE